MSGSSARMLCEHEGAVSILQHTKRPFIHSKHCLSQSMAAASPSSAILLPFYSAIGKRAWCSQYTLSAHKTWSIEARCSASRMDNKEGINLVSRRSMVGLVLGAYAFCLTTANANGAGLPPEEKPRLCDIACEKELENMPMVTTESGLQYKDIKIGLGPSPPVGFQVAANYVAMVPSGQIFDSSLEKGQPYIFRVGSGQVIKGLDEGILSMKTGGKRRLYIPGPLAFPKGVNSAPGRPRVAPNSPVIFDVSLEYIPGLEFEE